MTLNGERVAFGEVTVPMFGAWTADVTLSVDKEITSPCTLVVGDLSLLGTVVRQAGFNGDRTARLVGGANGWSKALPAKGYSHVVGVKLSSILKDAADECGETIVLETDRNVGTLYTRDAGKASDVLALQLSGQWYIDNAGVTQTKARSASPIVTPFTMVTRNGARGDFEIATEAIAAWTPGRTFTSNTVITAQTISSVTIRSTNEGKTRLFVLSADTGVQEKLRAAIQSIVRAELSAFKYSGVWEYEIFSATENEINARSLTTMMPDLTRVPVMPGVMGEDVTPKPGDRCRIQFVNQNPAQPECIQIDGSPLAISFGGSAASIEMGPVPLPLARALPTVTAFGAIATYIAAVTAAATANPASYTPFAAAIIGPGGTVATALGLVGAAVPTTVVSGT